MPTNKWANEIHGNFKEETQKPISGFCLFVCCFFMCSIFLAIREMQTKTTLRSFCLSQQGSSQGNGRHQMLRGHGKGGKGAAVVHCRERELELPWELVWRFLKTIKLKLPKDPLGIHTRMVLHTTETPAHPYTIAALFSAARVGICGRKDRKHANCG